MFSLGIFTGGVTTAQELPDERHFYMGFTPFPYAISIPAVAYTYQQIAQDADLIVHHFDNGVPWPEALTGEAYSENIRNDWNWRKAQTPPNHQRLVTITPIDFMRTGLAAYRGTADDMPLPAPWDSYDFDHPHVITAFERYSQDVIAFFEPDYFLMGIEVNLLMKNNPGRWDAYLRLHREVYARLKQSHPELPIFISVTGIDLLEGYTDANHAAQMRALSDMSEYTDLLGLSVYPYMTTYMTNSIPMDIFDRLAELTTLPLAVTETGYPAQAFSIQVEQGPHLEFNGTPALQEMYIQLLLTAAQTHDMAFVVNFVLRDYDELWQTIGGREDLTIAWRDTGLYDEAGSPRTALETWRAWLQVPHTQ
jgi:hypothetical protein